MMKKINIGIAAAFLGLVPQFAFAQTKDLKYLINLFAEYLQYAIYLIIALATVVFIWGIYQYFFSADTDKKEALQYVLYGTIGFFIMLSFWGIVNIFRNTVKLDNSKPSIPFVGSTGSATSGSGQNVSGSGSSQNVSGSGSSQNVSGSGSSQNVSGSGVQLQNVPARTYDPSSIRYDNPTPREESGPGMSL